MNRQEQAIAIDNAAVEEFEEEDMANNGVSSQEDMERGNSASTEKCMCRNQGSENSKWADFEWDIICVKCAARWSAKSAELDNGGSTSSCRETSSGDDVREQPMVEGIPLSNLESDR